MRHRSPASRPSRTTWRPSAASRPSCAVPALMNRSRPQRCRDVVQSFVGGDNFIIRTGEVGSQRHFSTDSMLYHGCRVVLSEAAEELWVVHEEVVTVTPWSAKTRRCPWTLARRRPPSSGRRQLCAGVPTIIQWRPSISKLLDHVGWVICSESVLDVSQ